VEGLAGGWNSPFIQDYKASITNLAVMDFLPYKCLPVQREAFQYVLRARASLVDELEELARDCPLAGEWSI